MASILRIHHVALVVDDLEKALSFWRDALGLSTSRIDHVAEQQSEIAFLPVGDSEIELVRPTTSESGVARFLAKRGPGMHHVCLEVADLDAVLRRLREKNIRLINPEPTTGAGGRRTVFIHPESAFGVLVELYEARMTGAQTKSPGR
jgi:methylmalonyl-CoA/ethylmalonyl-CoA epimerase